MRVAFGFPGISSSDQNMVTIGLPGSYTKSNAKKLVLSL